MAESKSRTKTVVKHGNGGGPLYFFGFIGSLVYFEQLAHNFGQVIVAFLKACVWPAFFTYDVFKFAHLFH